ncbi:MAG: hypothetical protein K1Y02_02120 [Candidatus Hydrogenedentes bacterium]|nr:hypothetical protein [Candidatus Hydrogenedentota bacterium]
MKCVNTIAVLTLVAMAPWCAPAASAQDAPSQTFSGPYYSGEGDVEYVQLLDIARRMFTADPEFQNLTMLYMPSWNGLVEGPTWGAWWIQNSYGTTYCALPFFEEPFVTFLQNSHDLWFSQMGDGQRKGYKDWVAPDGCLCDAASPGWIVYKQGDGRTDIHDWGMEFTAAGVLMQSELLLISRDAKAIAHYVPLLERSANFIETRRDPSNNLFLAGPAGNLLAPSYAGWKKPDGSYDKAYLTGLSITYIAALDRLIEVEKLAGAADKAALYAERRDRAREGLKLLTTDEGYFIKSLDPDGTKHGVYGAAKHGYFEASPNHDAIAFRVVDDAQAAKIYDKIASIPLLRRHDIIIANEPGLDDMYEEPTSWLWQHGTWVNGGHWSTCEARMIMGYYRLGKYEDARRSMKHMMTFARDFRLDNPLVDFGNAVYQPKEMTNLCYDSLGPMAALIRGLFEYVYKADALTVYPHIPSGITRLEQKFPIRFGTKLLYFTTTGQGPVTAVNVNGKAWTAFDGQAIRLAYDQLPDTAFVDVALGGAALGAVSSKPPKRAVALLDQDALAQALKMSGTNTLPLRIGADSQGGNKFVGKIWQVRIYEEALTAEQLKTARREPLPLPADALKPICAWTFEYGESGHFKNWVGQNFALKMEGSVKSVGYAIDPEPGFDWIRGCANFTGHGWLETPHNAKLSLANRGSIFLVVTADEGFQMSARLVDKIPVGSDNGYLLDIGADRKLRLITCSGTLSTDVAIPAEKMTTVAATWDAAGDLRIYIDGKCVASRPCEPQPGVALVKRVTSLAKTLEAKGLGETYEGRHAQLAADAVTAIVDRQRLIADGKITPIEDSRRAAADQLYVDTAMKICQGFERVMNAYKEASEPEKANVYGLWTQTE